MATMSWLRCRDSARRPWASFRSTSFSSRLSPTRVELKAVVSVNISVSKPDSPSM